MKDFATILRTLTRRIRSLQTTELLPSEQASDETVSPASTRSLYRAETAQWGVDQAHEILRRLERRGSDGYRTESVSGPDDRFLAADRSQGVRASRRRRPRQSLRSRLDSRPSPTPRGLLS